MPTHCGLGHWRTIQTLCSGPAPAVVVTLQVMAVMVIATAIATAMTRP